MTTKYPHSGKSYLLNSDQTTCNCHVLPSPEGRYAGQREESESAHKKMILNRYGGGVLGGE